MVAANNVRADQHILICLPLRYIILCESTNLRLKHFFFTIQPVVSHFIYRNSYMYEFPSVQCNTYPSFKCPRASVATLKG